MANDETERVTNWRHVSNIKTQVCFSFLFDILIQNYQN